MMQRGQVQARTFKNMAEPFSSSSEHTENVPSVADGDGVVKRRLSFSLKKNISLAQEPNTARLVQSLQIVCRLSAENAERLPSDEAIIGECTEEKNAANRKDVSLKQNRANNTEDKENAAVPHTDITEGNTTKQLQGLKMYITVYTSRWIQYLLRQVY